MVKFKINWGNKGKRVSIINSTSIVNARLKFKKIHPRAKIDSTELVKKR